ncbi:MAG: hypothetical protein OEV86_13000 [Candidatus Krumholzibacteria bacterium]|nr:hypothetical protein [Candidatus Krumholzibacteria bacterium]
MKHKDRIELMFAVTLCGTLLVGTVAIPFLMFTGHNVAKEVSIALISQWAVVAGLMWKSLGGREP